MASNTIQDYLDWIKDHPKDNFPKELTIKDKLSLCWDDIISFPYSVKRFFCKVKYILSWVPVLYKDEQFDYSFFYRIVLFKLQHIEKYYSKFQYPQQVYDPALDSPSREEKIKGQISECVTLLNNFLDDGEKDELLSKEKKVFEEKWGEIKSWSVPLTDEEGLFEWHCTRDNIKTEEDVKQYNKELKELIVFEKKQIRTNYSKFHTLLRKNSLDWWY